MPAAPRFFDDVAECVETTLRRLGNRIVLAMPLGIGKPNPLANEFYRRACQDPSIDLKIFTALSLSAPRWHNELERRFLQPLVERIFGSYQPLDYVRDLYENRVPANVRICEFFLSPGAFLRVEHAQRHYTSLNYTQVAREVAKMGVNVIAQLVARRDDDGRTSFSFGSNADVTLDLLEELEPARRDGRNVLVIGQVHRQMPYMFGPAEVPARRFDYIVDQPRYDFDLFAPPNLPLNLVDYAIGVHAANLVRDGGCLQLGIGELGDAVVYCLQLRQQQNAEFRDISRILHLSDRFSRECAELGGNGTFERGLYACTEMFVDGFLDLYRSGVLKRRVHDHALIQRLLDSSALTEHIDETFLAVLHAAGVTSPLAEAEFAQLQRAGVFRPDCSWFNGELRTADGTIVSARLDSAKTRKALLAHCTHRELANGVVMHGGFFLGPRGFYAGLRELPDEERRGFSMCGVSFINQLDGADRDIRIAQRRDGRFINSTMMVTLLGASIADGLADGQVVSGVGGQYNFVAMAHALPSARSITSVRSTRTKNGETRSNIVWNYGHTTIPRHLRDVVVTEYGIADLRGKNDEEVIAALLNVADSRFQNDLLQSAREAGKIDAQYRIPAEHRNNYPQALKEQFTLARARGLFSEFPFGTDLTPEEILLSKALSSLQEKTQSFWPKLQTVAGALLRQDTPAQFSSCLARMGLQRPANRRERLWQRLLVQELKAL